MESQRVRHHLGIEQQQSEGSGQATQNWLQDEFQQIVAHKPLLKRPSRANPGHNMSFISHPINCHQRSLSVVYAPNTLHQYYAPILWPPDVKSWLIGKDPDAGKDWGQEGKGTTKDEIVGRYHRLDGHGFGWTPGVGDGQGGLVCCSSWDRKESDMTEWLNWTELNYAPNVLWGRGLPHIISFPWQ